MNAIKAALLGGVWLWAAPALAETVVAPATGDAGDAIQADETVTVTATRVPTKVADAPATVSVITAERIADEGVTDIKELIRYEPGVSVTRQPARFGAALGTTGRAGNEGFTIRGIGGNRVLIQVDGIRVPDGFTFGAQSAGRGDYVDLGLVRSVEILRGPASALYGSDGLAGAVSFITSDPKDFLTDGQSVGGLVRAGYSTADKEFAETAIVAAQAGAWSSMAAYTRRDYKALDNKGTNDVIGALRTTPNPTDGRSDAILGRLVYEPGNGNRVRLTGEAVDTRVFANVLSGLTNYSTLPLPGTRVDLLQARDTGGRKRVSLDWTWDGGGTGDGVIEYARAAAFWGDSKDVQFTDEDRSPAADRERLNTFENQVYGLLGELRAAFDTGAAAHRVAFGGDVSWTQQKGLRDGVLPPAGEVYPTRAFPVTDYMLAGIFVSDEIKLGALTLYPALRFDAYDLNPQRDPLLPRFTGAKQSGSRLSPKLGAVLKLGDAGFRVFGGYSQGFKAPEPSQVNNFFENIAFGYTSIPNPDLKPERSESFEGGVRFANGLVNAEIVAFHGRYKNFIEQVPVRGAGTAADPTIFQFVNRGRTEISGGEARLEVRPGGGFVANAALSYATGDSITPAGVRIPLQSVDPVKVVTGVGYDAPGRRFGGRFIATFVASQDVDQTGALACANSPNGGCFRGEDRFVLDLTAYARVADRITLRAGLFNLTDQKYWWWSDIRGLSATSAVRDAFSQPGRNLTVSATVRF